MMIRTFRYILLIVFTFVGCTGPHNVSESKKTGNVVSLEWQHKGFRCILPPFPENGHWTIINGKEGPNETIHEDAVLKFQCHPGYDLTPNYPYVFCDTHWNPDIMPKCLRSTIYQNIPPSNSTETCGDVKRLKRQNDGFKCTLPPFPENGKWNLLIGAGIPGDKVDIDTGLKFQCNPGYKLTPKHPFLICDTSWSIEIMPKCLRRCQELYSTPTITLKCKDVTGNAINCSEAAEGTYLTYRCIPYYETLGHKQSLFCRGGEWDSPEPVCKPVCGKKVENGASPLVYGGYDTGKFDFPWIAAVYRKVNDKFMNNCGGTLISPRIVLTAAHCVSNNYGDAIPADDIEIGVGKYYNKYKDTRDIYAQYSKTARVLIHEEFKQVTRLYLYDIALIVTKKPFTLSPVVQPACYHNIDSINPHVGSEGELAGWGRTEDGEASDTLRTIRLPYKQKTTCTQELPIDFSNKYYVDDKICAGFYNQNKSVCPGDSGSGLVFLNSDDNRYYVLGIVSLQPKIPDVFCNIQNNALYTKVGHYYEWLDIKSAANNYGGENCMLPPFPKHGKWEMEIGPEKLPGDLVHSTSVLIYSCSKGYKLSTTNTKYYCDSTLAPPFCDLLCSLPKDTGPCRGQQVNWYFDVRSGLCSPFIYGGCDGNENRFQSIEKCESTCMRPVGTGINIQRNCTDNLSFANCPLIVKGRYCYHKYYQKFCCRSCAKAGFRATDGPN